MSKYLWEPTQVHLTQSNIARFMKSNGISNHAELIEKSKSDIEWFWEAALKDLNLKWFQPYQKLVEGGLPFATWFQGGQTNIVLNCLDQHQNSAQKNKAALIWEGDCGATKKLTYTELNAEVNRAASGLKKLGIQPGDRIAIYMPMIPEMIVAFFASLKIGAAVVPIFSGFGPEPTAIRLDDAEVKLVFTSDYGLRRGKEIAIKANADLALKQAPSVKHVVVAKRLFKEVPWTKGRDLWWDDFLAAENTATETAQLPAEHTSLIIYTSGTTGKPKGCVHTHAGALAQVMKEVAYTMDCKANDTFFWVTDIGWMMGPWEMIGTTAMGATLVIFEGAPDYPQPNRLWEIVEKHQVSILGISPTAIRLLKKTPIENVTQHNLNSLRILGSTGEAWDPESYQWFFEHVGQKKCPIMNISGGTEILGCHLAPLPIAPLKACSLGGPSLGMDVDVFDEDGNSLRGDVGYLVCKKPAPSMTKGFLNNQQRYLDTYFAKWPNIWNHGDWAFVDEDGCWFLRGRADDVIKVSGHRTGPAEIESALMADDRVAECATIGVPHNIKGESIVCFVVLKTDSKSTDQLAQELRKGVGNKLGKTLTPEQILFVNALPKTRSAKIVRGAIKKKYLGNDLGDTSSIENLDALEAIPIKA